MRRVRGQERELCKVLGKQIKPKRGEERRGEGLERRGKSGGHRSGRWGGGLTTPPRCRVDRCVSGMNRTGWVTWSSKLLKKVHSAAIELLTKPLLAKRETEETTRLGSWGLGIRTSVCDYLTLRNSPN